MNYNENPQNRLEEKTRLAQEIRDQITRYGELGGDFDVDILNSLDLVADITNRREREIENLMQSVAEDIYQGENEISGALQKKPEASEGLSSAEMKKLRQVFKTFKNKKLLFDFTSYKDLEKNIYPFLSAGENVNILQKATKLFEKYGDKNNPQAEVFAFLKKISRDPSEEEQEPKPPHDTEKTRNQEQAQEKEVLRRKIIENMVAYKKHGGDSDVSVFLEENEQKETPNNYSGLENYENDAMKSAPQVIEALNTENSNLRSKLRMFMGTEIVLLKKLVQKIAENPSETLSVVINQYVTQSWETPMVYTIVDELQKYPPEEPHKTFFKFLKIELDKCKERYSPNF